MKKFGLLVITLTGFSSTFFAQQNWCGTDSHLHKTFEENPELVQPFIEHNVRLSNGQYAGVDRTDPIIIPVVVHVIHDNGVGNISYEQILSGLEMLNEDYNRQNADTLNTRNTAGAPFEPLAVSFDISFALAKIDPNGNCTNGVERRNSPGATYGAGENAKYNDQGGLDAWPRDRYMNIWIVNSIESSGEGTTLGYAEFPQFDTHGYAVIIRHDSYGNVGTATGDRTLTHEIGHCLGLLHTFQGPFFGGGTGCHTTDCAASGDFCCDTPPATAAHWDCPPTYNSCTSVPINDPYGSDVLDQWENYMSYAPCQNMFSAGQYAMVSGNLTDIDFLENLVSLANQTATGVLAPSVLCQASFYSDAQTICAGNTISFFDESYFNVTGWSWTFEGASPGTSTSQNPVVLYNTSGSYDVTLEATDGISTVSITLTDFILVLPDPGDGVPYKEGFETLSMLPDNNRFLVENGNGTTTWQLTNSTAYTGHDCAFINNFGVDDGSTDELISGTVDLSSIAPSDNLVFNFRYAYRKRATGDDEWLRFYISKDCGQTWTLRKNLHGSGLNTETSTTSYVPATQEEWTEVSVTNITNDYYVSDFRYKFEFTNDNGNNIYLDHINMYPASMTGLAENTAFTSLEVYPNPTTQQSVITFVSAAQNNCVIEVYDAIGNVISTIYTGPLAAGSQSFQLNTAGLAKGIYIIRVSGDDAIQTIKLIKE